MVNPLKFGVFLYQPEPVEGVDFNFYRIKPESGTVGKPNPEMYTNIACFGDNALAAKRPEWISISKDGPAFRTNKKYNLRWDVLCMTNPEVREYNLNLIEECARATPGISISSQHFADHGFCVCPRCVELWRTSGLNWVDWRAKTVTAFLKEVRERVAPTKQSMTVATRVARTGIDGIIFLAEKAQWIREFQKNAVADKETRDFLKHHGGDEVLKLFNRWKKLV